MLEIFALAQCLYFPAHPEWNTCYTLGPSFKFSTAEQCEQHRVKYQDGGGGGRIVKFVCVHKSVPTWQPVEKSS